MTRAVPALLVFTPPTAPTAGFQRVPATLAPVNQATAVRMQAPRGRGGVQVDEERSRRLYLFQPRPVAR